MTVIRPPLAELLAYLAETRSRLIETATQINPAFASIRPRGDRWSAAENLDHLAKVEAGVARMVEKSVEWARSRGVGPPQSDESVMSSLDGFSVIEPPKPAMAPEMVSPAEDSAIDASLESLRRSRERLLDAMHASADLDLSNVTRPLQDRGKLNMYQWVLFVAQHEERHRRQIDRTMEEVTGRAAECAPIV